LAKFAQPQVGLRRRLFLFRQNFHFGYCFKSISYPQGEFDFAPTGAGRSLTAMSYSPVFPHFDLTLFA
jgi:hypothetical protein